MNIYQDEVLNRLIYNDSTSSVCKVSNTVGQILQFWYTIPLFKKGCNIPIKPSFRVPDTKKITIDEFYLFASTLQFGK